MATEFLILCLKYLVNIFVTTALKLFRLITGKFVLCYSMFCVYSMFDPNYAHFLFSYSWILCGWHCYFNLLLLLFIISKLGSRCVEEFLFLSRICYATISNLTLEPETVFWKWYVAIDIFLATLDVAFAVEISVVTCAAVVFCYVFNLIWA